MSVTPSFDHSLLLKKEEGKAEAGWRVGGNPLFSPEEETPSHPLKCSFQIINLSPPGSFTRTGLFGKPPTPPLRGLHFNSLDYSKKGLLPSSGPARRRRVTTSLFFFFEKKGGLLGSPSPRKDYLTWGKVVSQFQTSTRFRRCQPL